MTKLICTALVLLTCLFHVETLQPFVITEQIIWESGGPEDVAAYRIPLLIQVPTGDLLAFSEARKYSTRDSGAKFIAMRRSSNGGDSWGPNTFILNNYNVPDGTNLGTITVDRLNSRLILIHTFCIHSATACVNGTGEKPAGIYMITSPDWGYSWSEPVYLADGNPLLKNLHYNPGPGYGIQKMYEPHKGRLVTCGQGRHSLFCLTSDDNGTTWQMTPGLMKIPYQLSSMKTGDFEPGEVQVIELKNGTLLINARNQMSFHCHCRIQALSFDGGETFPLPYVTLKEELIDPRVCGSLLPFGDVLFFSNPFNPSKRVNLTLHWSVDSGETYPNFLTLYEKSSGYSCLSAIDENHIGLVYEKDDLKYISFLKIQLNF
ncbi:sialidase-1-like [Diadema setosum]|uniref:sialidase-1-like n=1 Tax=Diadema setosum TaxID=31175 RepID=UPI003B3A6894